MAPVQKAHVQPSRQGRQLYRQAGGVGVYDSDSEVVRAGLRALRNRDATIEEWLLKEIVPVYEAMHADPGRGIPVDELGTRLHARHDGRPKPQQEP
jgi:antitoxin ParD1/3/4